MATVVHAVGEDALEDPNRVKVVLDRARRALYFSRSPIPYTRPGQPRPTTWQHVGLYAFRRPFLAQFIALPPTAGERAEGLEQLRALEHGHQIHCATVEGFVSVPVDVPADVEKVLARLRERGR